MTHRIAFIPEKNRHLSTARRYTGAGTDGRRFGVDSPDPLRLEREVYTRNGRM